MARQCPRQVHHLINALTGEAGHMARQSPSAMDSSKSSESSSGKKDIVCHAYSKTGHKAFSCPN